MGPFLLENQLCLFRPFVCNSAEKGSVFHTFPIKNGMISRFLLIIPQRPVRESNPHLVLRRNQNQINQRITKTPLMSWNALFSWTF